MDWKSCKVYKLQLTQLQIKIPPSERDFLFSNSGFFNPVCCDKSLNHYQLHILYC